MRSMDNVTKKELSISLHHVFPTTSHKLLSEKDVQAYWRRKKEIVKAKSHLFYDVKENGVVAFIFANQEIKHPVAGVFVETIQEPSHEDLMFGNYLCRVFNEDLRTAPQMKENSELWLTLRQAQFRRAIAKYSSFSTIPMLEWIQAVENSTALRYENKPFALALIMTKNKEHLTGTLQDHIVKFSKKIDFQKGLLEEKWIRSAVDGKRVGLVGVGLNGDLIGMFNVPSIEGDPENSLFAPHESLVPLQKQLRTGMVLFVTSEKGDVYIVLPKGVVFQKTQGIWHFLDYNSINKFITTHMAYDLSVVVLRAALDLSYERSGAIICILDEDVSIDKFIHDYRSKDKVNKNLRDSVRGLDFKSWPQRQVIVSAAKTDGALIIDKTGRVCDVACMIGDPTPEVINALKIKELIKYPGARSTAAWNASWYGTTLKISEDGPITIFKKGHLIGQIG